MRASAAVGRGAPDEAHPGDLFGIELGDNFAGPAVVHEVSHRRGTVTTGQPAIWASISTPGSPRSRWSGCRRRSREDLGDVVAVAEDVDVLAEPRAATSRRTGGGAVRRRRQRGGRPRLARIATNASSARSGRFCSIRWPMKPMSPMSSGLPSSARRSRAAASRSTHEWLRVAEVRDRQIGPLKPSRASSSPRSGVSATAASMRRTTRRHRRGRLAATFPAGNRGCVARPPPARVRGGASTASFHRAAHVCDQSRSTGAACAR